MEPFSWTAAAAIVGSLASVGGMVMQGMRAGQAGQVNTAIFDRNAQIARDKAEADAQDIAIKNRQALGSIRASAGASGLLADEGSPLEALLTSAQQGEVNRRRRLWEGQIEADNAQLGGYASAVQTSNAQWSAYGQAGASLLTGASKVGDLLNPSGKKSYDSIDALIKAKGIE